MNPEHEELVRERAHLMWEDEGRPEGCAARHWMAAEQSLAEEQLAWETPANAGYVTSDGVNGPTDPDAEVVDDPSEDLSAAPVQIPYPAMAAPRS